MEQSTDKQVEEVVTALAELLVACIDENHEIINTKDKTNDKKEVEV